MKRSVSIFVVLLVIFGFFSVDVKEDIRFREELSYLEGDQFPGFNATDIHGDSVDLNRIISENRYVWINFWTTWCSPCRRQMPMMAEIYKEYYQDSLAIVAVNVGEDSFAVQDYLSDQPMPFSVLLDSQKNISSDFNIQKLPTSYLVDSTRTIREVGTGVQRSWEFKISNMLKDE